MLTDAKQEAWSMMPDADRQYATDVEVRFFAAVENPPHPTEALKELVRNYGHLLAPKR